MNEMNDSGAIGDLEVAVVDPGQALQADFDLPQSEFASQLNPGGVKHFKGEAKRSDSMYFIEPEKLVVMEGFNIRVRTQSYLDHVQALAESMIEHGFDSDSPLLVFVREVDGSDEMVVIDGHSRLEAVGIARKAGIQIDTVPVIFAPKSMNMDDALLKLRRKNTGRLLTAYELAVLCKRFDAREYSHAEIARGIGKTPAYVASLLLLAQAPRSLTNLVIAGAVTATLAIAEIRAHGPEKAEARLKAMVEKAAEKGKGKVTSKNRPEAKFESGVKKAAPQLFERVRSISTDPGYAGLSQENRDAIAALVDELEALKSS
ncbi:TPA: ParB/RepB/Spo0J family partition protein [Stenotrophomonas maltophilia]